MPRHGRHDDDGAQCLAAKRVSMRLRPKRGGEGHARNEDLRAESCRLPDGRGHEAAAVMLRVCYGRGCPRHGDRGYEEHSGSHSLARAAEDRVGAATRRRCTCWAASCPLDTCKTDSRLTRPRILCPTHRPEDRRAVEQRTRLAGVPGEDTNGTVNRRPTVGCRGRVRD